MSQGSWGIPPQVPILKPMYFFTSSSTFLLKQKWQVVSECLYRFVGLSFEARTHVTQAGLESPILLSTPPKCSNHRYVPPHTVRQCWEWNPGLSRQALYQPRNVFSPSLKPMEAIEVKPQKRKL